MRLRPLALGVIPVNSKPDASKSAANSSAERSWPPVDLDQFVCLSQGLHAGE
jgi:hypothetical protein